jgi:hypothetical protein
MGTHAADISNEFDVPGIGSVTFTALNEREVEFLRWMAEDLVGRQVGRKVADLNLLLICPNCAAELSESAMP